MHTHFLLPSIATLALVLTACGGSPEIPYPLCGTIVSVAPARMLFQKGDGTPDDSIDVHQIHFTDGRVASIRGVPGSPLDSGSTQLIPVLGRTTSEDKEVYLLAGDVIPAPQGCDATITEFRKTQKAMSVKAN